MDQLFIYIAVVLAGSGLIRAFGLLSWPAAIITAAMALLLLFAGGWSWLTPALAFLITGSMFTRWPGASRTRDRTRRARQVLANGLTAMIFAGLAIYFDNGLFAAAVAGCFAAAAADTWATEWGGSYGGAPISLRSLRRVPPGQSGAVSVVGTIATTAGAFFVAAASALTGMIPWSFVTAVGLAGLAGSLLDSLTGAWLQGLWKAADGAILEQPVENRSIRPLRGLRWVDNDAVNLIATLAGGILAFLWAG